MYSSGVILLSLIKGTVSLIIVSEKLFLKTTESLRTKLLASRAKESFKLSLRLLIIFSSNSVSLFFFFYIYIIYYLLNCLNLKKKYYYIPILFFLPIIL
jgi:hypothetical protein